MSKLHLSRRPMGQRFLSLGHHLASDHSTDKDVLDSLINWFDTFTPKPDVLCYLYATAPFVSASTLGGCYNLLINSNASRVQTITTYPYPVQRSFSKIPKVFFLFSGHSTLQHEVKTFRSFTMMPGVLFP